MNRAPEPEDIIWENCGITDKGFNRFLANFFSSLVVLFFFCFFTGLKMGRVYNNHFIQIDQIKKLDLVFIN